MVSTVELPQVTRDTLVDLLQAPLYFCRREVLVAIVDCFELASINRDDGLGEQIEAPAVPGAAPAVAVRLERMSRL